MDKIEICCICGFVHRDDRRGRYVGFSDGERDTILHQLKAHYHWDAASQDDIVATKHVIQRLEVNLPPTVCAEHVTGVVNWRQFAAQRTAHWNKWGIRHGSTNAPLPSIAAATMYRFARAYVDLAIAYSDGFV